MNVSTDKVSASIRLDAGLMRQLRADAKADNRSLSSFLELLLYRYGYRAYNEETVSAYSCALDGDVAGVIDPTSTETIEASLLGDD